MPLYCENHRAVLTDRGGSRIIGQFENVSSVTWGRRRDDISEGSITIAQPGQGCLKLLEQAHCNRHELVIYRGNDRVWEGPITHIGRHADVFTISARDVMHYVYRTVAHAEYDSAAYWSPDEKEDGAVFVDNTEPVVDRVYRMLTGELARKEALTPPIQVVPYITKIRAAVINDERKANRKTLAYGTSVFADMESLATYGGLDYTVVGRRIIINDNRVPIGKTPVITDKDIIGEVVVTSYGMDSFTAAYVAGENGMYGVSGGIDPYYGEWEYFEDMMDADSVEPPTQNALDNAADINMSGKLPVPTIVRIPENSRLNPNGVLSMRDLVPGVTVPVRAELPAITLVQNQKLSSVDVRETGEEGETITITLSNMPSSTLAAA